MARTGRKDSEILYGVGVCPGTVVGTVALMDPPRRRVAHIYLDAGRVQAEIRRFEQALNAASEQLKESRAQFAEHLAEYTALVDSHLAIVHDKMFAGAALQEISRQGINAEWALEQVLERTKTLFASLVDPYLQARYQDVEQVAATIFRLLHGEAETGFGREAGDDAVVVAVDLAPQDILHMKQAGVRGVITELGGATSHLAILARTLGIPSVMGVDGISRQAEQGAAVVLDGQSGRICLYPSPAEKKRARDGQARQQQFDRKVAYFTHLAPETEDGLRIDLLANIEFVEEAPLALQYGAGGIGLYRSEYSYLSGKTVPDEESLYAAYRELLQLMAPFPVTIRTFDMGGDKSCLAGQRRPEKNPALGLRAIRLCLHEERFFRHQLRALYRASIHGKLRIMFPMISTSSELHRVLEIIGRVQEELRGRQIPFADRVPIGIMIEVPGAAAVADTLARKVDFFSIGTNDLIQYVLAIDRGNTEVSHLYDPLNPAVLRLLRQVIAAGHGAGIEVGICGEMAADPLYTPLLLGLGVDAVSCTPMAIPYLKRMVRQCHGARVLQLAQQVAGLTLSSEIRQLLFEHIRAYHPKAIADLEQRLRAIGEEGAG